MKFLLIASQPTSILGFRGSLLQTIAQHEIEIIVLAPFNMQSNIDEQLLEKGYKTINIDMQRTGLNPVADLRTLWQLYQKIVYLKPDYVLGYTIKPVIYGSIAAALARVPHRFALITGLGYAFQNIEHQKSKKNILQRAVFRLYKLALSQCNKVFFQNSDDLSLFLQLGLLTQHSKACVVNGSGVDLTHYEYNLATLESYKLDTSLKFLMIGRIIGDKGIREYVNAAKLLKEKYGKKVDFQLIGGLDLNPTAIKQAELDDWVAQGWITYLGRLKDVRPAIAASHVFVLPSYREGTSRSILEAMSIGRPIVTTNVPGCKQLVVEGENGYLAEVKSVENLVRAIEKVIESSPEKLLSMGKTSRQIVENKYDVHKVNHHMLTEMGIIGHNNV